jgi:hypothetical protein
MSGSQYKEILEEALIRFGVLNTQKESLEVEITKQREFIVATVNMLSDDESAEFKARVAEALKTAEAREASLTESIRQILQKKHGSFLTAAQVRDHLVGSGFNFSGYMSNPLASVSTTLRRLKPEEVEIAEVRGVAAYKWVGGISATTEDKVAAIRSSKGLRRPPWLPDQNK